MDEKAILGDFFNANESCLNKRKNRRYFSHINFN